MIDHLMIGAIDYEVELVKDLEFKEDDGTVTKLNGYHQEHVALISIRADLNSGIERVIVMHEVIHALLHQRGHEYPHDEHIIEGLSYALVDLFHRNPHFLPYLMNSPEGQAPHELASDSRERKEQPAAGVSQDAVPGESCSERCCHRL